MWAADATWWPGRAPEHRSAARVTLIRDYLCVVEMLSLFGRSTGAHQRTFSCSEESGGHSATLRYFNKRVTFRSPRDRSNSSGWQSVCNQLALWIICINHGTLPNHPRDRLETALRTRFESQFECHSGLLNQEALRVWSTIIAGHNYESVAICSLFTKKFLRYPVRRAQ